MIHVENLSKVFRTEEIETVALNNVSFDIKQGEFVAVMGPSGCGKSTLLNILGLLDNPTSGKYELLGKEVGSLKEKERTQYRKGNIGFVFQSFNLIDELNVFENVELPLIYMKIKASQRKQMVNDILKRMNIAHRASHFPQQLSGGQQQRVAIARAVIANPKLILADEPTGNLDSKNGKEVMELLTELNREGTISLIYTYGENKTVNAVVNVSQQPGEEPVPTITITTEDPLTLAADGGSYTIEYEITDPTEDGSISADAGDAGWITDINCDTEGVITFSAAANDTDGERQAIVKVTYTYNGTETASDAITVSQQPGEEPVPTITITTEDPLTLAADGGSYTIEYEISDPTEDGSISADAGDAGWITDINCDTEGVITFSVAANDTDGERQATITVTYTYNGTETVSESIDAVQEANESPVQGYDYEYEMIYLSILNYGGTPCNYYITMSDTEGDAYGTARYVLDIYANSDTSMPPAGTYTMTANGGEDMTASSGYSSTRIEDESGNVIVNCKLAEGTITISYEGSTMILDAVLTDREGNIHHVTYN